MRFLWAQQTFLSMVWIYDIFVEIQKPNMRKKKRRKRRKHKSLPPTVFHPITISHLGVQDSIMVVPHTSWSWKPETVPEHSPDMASQSTNDVRPTPLGEADTGKVSEWRRGKNAPQSCMTILLSQRGREVFSPWRRSVPDFPCRRENLESILGLELWLQAGELEGRHESWAECPISQSVSHQLRIYLSWMAYCDLSSWLT